MYILWDGVELDKSKAAVQNLQRMIWGLESFRVFDITLASALEILGKARLDFDHTTREVRKRTFALQPQFLTCY
jgi:hypothetical protein